MLNNQNRILILDADSKNAELLEQYVAMMGYEARSAGDGGSGRRLITDWEPDLVLTNLDLPEITGMNLLKELKADSGTREIPVVVMSDQASEEVVILALSTGAADFLSIPIKMSELTPKLQHALEIKRYRQELRLVNQRLEREKQGLSRFFSDDIARRIIDGEIGTDLGGDSLDATIMFVDMRQSTTIAEMLRPGEFARLLSDVLGGIMEIIFKNSGSVNKILGDGILATYGCPIPTENDSMHCVNSALEIRQFINDYNSNRPEFLKDDVRMGIGIASGVVFAGNVGSVKRLEYTVLGDAVNLAARLEKLTRRLNSDILIDENTRVRLRQDYNLGEPVRARVRGRQESVHIFPVLD